MHTLKVRSIRLKHALGVLATVVLAVWLPFVHDPSMAHAQSSGSPIDIKYAELGGPAGLLGSPITTETRAPDGVGLIRHYQNGSIYWSPPTGAHFVRGAIRNKWESLNWERGPLGYPTSDEALAGNDGTGRASHFQNGSIYWSPALDGPHVVRGAIRDKWESLGWERGLLGYPITDEAPAGNDGAGRASHFQNGSIYWSPALDGPHVVRGAIRDKWESLGWERGPLGYPISDELGGQNASVRFSAFQNGSIYGITRPNVQQSGTLYPDTAFINGDQVLADAGGCVQTGGSGATWRRYVDPQGPDSGRLYHGGIRIPGAAPNGVRFQQIIGQWLRVSYYPATPTLPRLILGYEDDDYSDNGYWGRDNGIDNQCLGRGDAYVILTILNSGPGPLDAPAQLVADRVRGTLAAALGIGLDAITLMSAQQVNWGDAGLACGGFAAQVVTPGYRVILGARGTRYDYHTDINGQIIKLCDSQ